MLVVCPSDTALVFVVMKVPLCFSRTQLSVEPQVRELQEQAVETESVGDAEQRPV